MDIFTIILGIFIGLFSLMFLVTAHEFGHFLMARKNGVNVLEFGICFPPRAIAWVKDPKTKKWKRIPKKDWKKPQEGLIFSLNWLPIGGFCQMDGESANDKRRGTFGKASFWSKTKILFGGVAMNWIIAMIIFTILSWTGMPNIISNQFSIESDTRLEYEPVVIAEVVEDSPADKGGVEVNDKIISIDGNLMTSSDDIINYNESHAGQTVTYQIQRQECQKEENNGCTETETIDKQLQITLNTADKDILLGVSMNSSLSKTYSTWSAPINGIVLTAQFTGETFKGVGEMIWDLFSGIIKQFSASTEIKEAGQAELSSVGDSVSGPVGIVGMFPALVANGPAYVAYIAAIISISLACMNVLPIPALDGGRWFLIALFKLRRKELTKEKEEQIVAKAFVVLMIIALAVTVLDIIRISSW